jgi:hypothetical protein
MLIRFQFLLILSFLVFAYNSSLSAQCIDFAHNSCLSQFGEFVHDGNNGVAEMKEGETAELYKTFFSGQTYRLVVCKSDNLPSIHVKVVDGDGKILFDNKNHSYDLVWDFAVKGTQKLVVQIKVLDASTSQTSKKSGCVGILFGIQKDQ